MHCTDTKISQPAAEFDAEGKFEPTLPRLTEKPATARLAWSPGSNSGAGVVSGPAKADKRSGGRLCV